MATTAPSLTVSYALPSAPDSYFDAIFGSSSMLGPAGSLLNAWCIRADLPLGRDTSYQYTGYVYSSYETASIRSTLPGIYTPNLDNINWLLNYYNSGADPSITVQDMQVAIWVLQKQLDYRSDLATLALQHDGYVPDAGELLAVIVDPVDANGVHDQTTIVETRAAKLGDRVWHDSDADGVQDADETGIAGATVQLVRDINGDGLIGAGEVLSSTTTDANGNYGFKGLTPGLNYQVRFTKPTDYSLGSPRQADGNGASGSNSDGALSDVIVLQPGEYNATIDAGFYKYASIGDKVWNDTNANGVQDVGETGKSGAKVQLYTCVDGVQGTLVASRTTDANGNYSFANLRPGDYLVKFIASDGSVLSTANVGNDALDSDAGSNGLTGCYTLRSGETNTTVDAGYYKNASLGDKVWNDTNANGVQDAGEAGKSGVKVQLYTCVDGAPGTLVATKTTDANGNYKFTGLKPGDYMVKFIAADGLVLTTANIGSDDLDSDAGSNGFTGCYALASGESNTTVDAGLVSTKNNASLGDRAWNDSNANGMQDAGETGKAGVVVNLFTSVNNLPSSFVASTVTDANGNYHFNNLAPGQYIVQFASPDGSILSSANVGNDAHDSDVLSSGFTGTYTLAAGQTDNTVDAGYYKNASLGDKVWNDSNANGVQDAGEIGKGGVMVQLYTCVNNAPGTLVATQTTDTNGNYGFSNLKPGDYMVKFVAADGSVLSTTNVGSDALDSDAGSNGFTGCYSLSSGENNTTVDAGFYQTASLGDRVWVDANANGVQDGGETGKSGVMVQLYTCVNNAPGTLVDSQLTDANGNYNFTSLKPGDYMVKFVAADGTLLSTANVDSDALDSDAGISGFTGCYALAAGEVNNTVDAGFFSPKPVLNQDQATVCEERSTTFNVLGNDLGTGLKLVGVAHESAALDSTFASRGGSLSFTADGQVSYKSMSDYYGFDKLVYTVEDSTGARYQQTVDVTVHAVSDAPTAGAGAAYHPGGWAYTPTEGGWAHRYSLSDFGTFSDAKDALQQFGNYNADKGVANDQDSNLSVILSGLDRTGGSITLNGVKLDFSGGKEHEVSLADIQAGKLVLEFQVAYVAYSLAWRYKDSGSVDNEACYDGSVESNKVSTTIHTPIALDLSGNGKIGVTGATSSYQKDAGDDIGRTVQFDMDADGQLDTIEWFDGSGDGILIDNRDGLAASDMNGSRLFGGDNGQFSDGYAKLRTLDTNGDGQLSGRELDGIQMWVDNGDAIVQDGEIQTLGQHGIASIATELTVVIDAQGKEHLQSSATRDDGSTLLTEDVFFLQDILAGGNLDALVGARDAGSTATAAVGDVTDVTQAAELLRQLSAHMEAQAATA